MKNKYLSPKDYAAQFNTSTEPPAPKSVGYCLTVFMLITLAAIVLFIGIPLLVIG